MPEINREPLLTEIEKQVLVALHDIPLNVNPLSEIEKVIGISSEKLHATISHLTDRKIIRKISPVIAHRNAGYQYNAMLLFKADDKKLEETASYLSRHKQISHVFQRNNKFCFNLYAMIHAKSETELSELILEIDQQVKLEMIVAETESEIKKESLVLLES